ncbi:hypothetical protein M569_12236 [Genlisea aurea]|uniref:Uncharacterized protein n=1 Tax=Genlisea aurea TaxID=192259 RepID=S8C6Z6_9LAMI|nr:hypothetical protein M569_12236 [Genlisea aurea]
MRILNIHNSRCSRKPSLPLATLLLTIEKVVILYAYLSVLLPVAATHRIKVEEDLEAEAIEGIDLIDDIDKPSQRYILFSRIFFYA